MTRTGADLSHHQATFDAAAYAASGEDFLALKATEAGSYVDPTFTPRWRAAATVGLPRAAYHFARPGTDTADAQADHFTATARRAGWRAGDAWALDLEDAGGLSPGLLLAWAERWINRVRAALGGRGLFYSGLAFVLGELGDPGRIPGTCIGWIARYTTAANPWAAPLRKPLGWPQVPDVWQCTNGQAGCVHQVASVGRCDWNRATDAAYAALFGPSEEDTLALVFDTVDEFKAAVRAALGLRPGEEAASSTDVATLLRGDATHPDNLDEIHKDTQAILAAVKAAADPELVASLVAGRLEITGIQTDAGGVVTVTFGPKPNA